ncbi:MAG: hypothetical protein AB7F35_25495 [Acetobacteraceae bacterium]
MGDGYRFVSVLVVFVPSLCWVVVLLAVSPVFGFADAVLWVRSPVAELVLDELVAFCPSGRSVVVVLDDVWASTGPLKARRKPIVTAAILDLVFIFCSSRCW